MLPLEAGHGPAGRTSLRDLWLVRFAQTKVPARSIRPAGKNRNRLLEQPQGNRAQLVQKPLSQGVLRDHLAQCVLSEPFGPRREPANLGHGGQGSGEIRPRCVEQAGIALRKASVDEQVGCDRVWQCFPDDEEERVSRAMAHQYQRLNGSRLFDRGDDAPRNNAAEVRVAFERWKQRRHDNRHALPLELLRDQRPGQRPDDRAVDQDKHCDIIALRAGGPDRASLCHALPATHSGEASQTGPGFP